MRKAAWVMALCLLLCGCAGRVELSLMAIALGIDADETGVTLTVKAPDYSAAARGEEGQKEYLTLSAHGEDWTQAAARLMREAPLEIRFGQLREVVVGQGARERHLLAELLGWADRLPNVRSHALVILCPGEARDLVEGQQPVIGKRLSKYLDIALSHIEAEGRIPATALSCAVRDLSGPWRSPLLAWTEGGAYALGSRQNGLLTAEQVQLFRLITGESQQYRLQGMGCSLRGRAHLAVEAENGQDTLLLRLPVTLTYSVYENPPAPGAEDLLQQQVAALLDRLQALGCDALGFGCMAVRRYGTLAAWLQSGWPERFCQARVSVTVEAKYRQEAER